MIYREKKRMEGWSTPKGSIGHITLEKLAIPETVKVFLDRKEIIPESFDILGHPNFTEEQSMLFMFKENELERKKGKYVPLEAEITYEERVFDIPKSSFDSVKGIEKSLTNLTDFWKMLNNRAIYAASHPNDRLHKFVVFGCYRLDEFGQIMSIEYPENVRIIRHGTVEPMEHFRLYNPGLIFSTAGRAIPKEDSACPCCGNKFTIKDAKENTTVYIDGKFYHNRCRRNYEHMNEIDRLTRLLMDIVYDSKDYTFEIQPNGYCSKSCCSHIPWLLFHTPDGDIIVGWRKRVISIEWQENYKPFDMKELFGSENVTKWDGKKRGIHAWGREKAYEYLETVRNAVNPNYKD